jgi:hypothetical protein
LAENVTITALRNLFIFSQSAKEQVNKMIQNPKQVIDASTRKGLPKMAKALANIHSMVKELLKPLHARRWSALNLSWKPALTIETNQ